VAQHDFPRSDAGKYKNVLDEIKKEAPEIAISAEDCKS
jgi:hypothetical protein